MINDDTIKLLNECNAGIKMGVEGIKEVIDNAESKELIDVLNKYLKDHEKLGDKTHEYLNKFHDGDKKPNPIASAMSKVKINVKMLQGNKDEQIADLMTDGCDMGIKSIARYLNKYPAALPEVKELAADVIKLEENFELDLRRFL
ncbi:DUF2383 domain-containing protein [Romboutsia sp. 13368]|uniref:DUF2383 domain-containing protein n=1 Tax=Romboutsia sp. 13368 TaxID=2708053 RepID=UPI0025EEB666|nr:DUF2383 domain-containing protein [Romboutsia sp. 13368]